MFANKSGKQGFRDTKAILCLLGTLSNPHRTLPAASGCASVPDALTAVPAIEKAGMLPTPASKKYFIDSSAVYRDNRQEF